MPKKVQMARDAEDEGEGPMPAWQRQKNLAEIQKLKVRYFDNLSNLLTFLLCISKAIKHSL